VGPKSQKERGGGTAQAGRWEAGSGRCGAADGSELGGRWTKRGGSGRRGKESAQGEERRQPGWAGWDLVLLFHLLPFFFSNPFETPNLFEFK
jgi:hypothetical protein